jgi:hypothetical protein
MIPSFSKQYRKVHSSTPHPGFARQRDDAGVFLAVCNVPHPFARWAKYWFCLVPAQDLTEEDMALLPWLNVGSSHGRITWVAVFYPYYLKTSLDCSPRAYQGRGRGNKFLNDDRCSRTGHVVGSGTADAEGNVVGRKTRAARPLQ